MHDCPDCGMACDCDGEDLYYDWPHPYVMNCLCDCADSDVFEEDEDDDE